MGTLAANFKQDAMGLIYSPFTELEFSRHVDTHLTKYKDFPKAMRCLERIQQHKGKICRTFTGMIRFESVNR